MLWAGNALSFGAQFIQQVAVNWLVYDLTGSGAILGALNGLRLLGALLIPVAGLAADRVSRRLLMFATQVTQVVMALGIVLALMLGELHVWHLFVFTLVTSAAQFFNQPVRQTLVFDVVPRSVLPNAIALGSVSLSVPRVVGPAVGGLLLAGLGPSGNFALQAGIFGAAAATIFMLRTPPLEQRERRSPLKEMAEGFAYVGRDRVLLTMLIMSCVPALCLWPYWSVLMPIFAKDVLGTGPTGLGILLSSIGVGGVSGAAAATLFGNADRRGLMQVVSMILFSLVLIGFAQSRSMPMACLFLFLGGFAEAFYVISNQTLVQLLAPEKLRGRITSLLQLTNVVFPLGGLIGGLMADAVGIRTTVTLFTSLSAAIGLAFLLGSARLRGLRISHLRMG